MDETLLFKGSTDRPFDFLKPEAWKHEEINGAAQPVVWKEKTLDQLITYPKRNQMSQLSCVTYGLAKQLAIDELSENSVWRELSPRSVYPYVVQPGGGSSSIDATKLVCKQGMTLEALLPTDGKTEEDVRKSDDYATDAKQIAFVYKPAGFVQANSDFETIASILQSYQQQGKKKCVTVSMIGQNNGTVRSLMPTPPNMDPDLYWYHRIVITDFGIVNGKKVLAYDNSWGTTVGNNGQQLLTKEYEPFIYGAIYTLNQPDNWQQLTASAVPPPKYTWAFDLGLGSSGDAVMALQVALQSMGMFPVSSVVKPTGFYAGVTQAAVTTFQKSFGIAGEIGVGPITRQQLNKIFGA